MDIAKAFEIVLELAKDNALDRDQARADGMADEYDEQQEALKMVEDFVVNQLGDD